MVHRRRIEPRSPANKAEMITATSQVNQQISPNVTLGSVVVLLIEQIFSQILFILCESVADFTKYKY